ncbi:uncharacterized protein F4822DRAFT_428245 [Hypoxylon trugodes]|uniref:uncharacterized protein n=1 Tax=Hypoxylon trugodes TaxID=326681 RepID=UPI002199459A|nr:uncharacterized protein F4822DRAFT_428245 [Hypoxylon trugodes]KAI1389904.1 hypothetical protein F4822DRAFT_428245 [Hypoxylon trugodes]
MPGRSDTSSDSSSLTRPSRLDTLTASRSSLAGGDFTLDKLMNYLRAADIYGPIQTQDCDIGSRSLGKGAQFEVFGRRAMVVGMNLEFDGPFVADRRPSWLSNEVVFRSKKTQIPMEGTRVELVAIKRALLATTGFQSPLQSSSHDTGASRRQIRDSIFEVLALSHSTLRSHPNIVTIIAWGYDSRKSNEMLFSPTLFMEHANMSLAECCKGFGVPFNVKIHLSRGLVAGLAALHQCGVIHGDIKPSNVLVFASKQTEHGCMAKLADFGCSVSELEVDGEPILPLGTQGWRAPEQGCRAVQPGMAERCDIWACARTIWSAIAFEGDVPPDATPNFNVICTKFPQALIPTAFIEDLCVELGHMLTIDFRNRTQDLSEIKSILAKEFCTEPGDSLERFLTFFCGGLASDDIVKLEDKSLTALPMIRSEFDTNASFLEKSRRNRKSWAYESRRAFDFASRDSALLRQLSSESIATSELFTIAIAYALQGKPGQEIDTLYKCAEGGYLPALALYAQISSGRRRLSGSLGVQSPRQGKTEWITTGVESGYLFPPQDWLDADAGRLNAAWEVFRYRGGYNVHYSAQIDTPMKNEVPLGSGLLGDLEEDLKDFAIHAAAAKNELKPTGLTCLLDIKSNLDKRDRGNDTPIIKCCMAGHIESLRALINAGADASVTNSVSGVSALHWLFVFPDEYVEEACLLLQRGGLSLQNPSQVSALESFHFPFAWPSGAPLHWAAFTGNLKAVEILVEKGVDLEIQDAAHQTSLHIAMKMGNCKVTNLLLRLGAKLSGPPNRNRSSFVHDFLWSGLELGADSEMEDWDAGTVYIPPEYDIMVFKGDFSATNAENMIHTLLEHQPRCLEWRDSRGWTCLNYLVGFGHASLETLKLIIERSPHVDDIGPDDVSVWIHAFLPTFSPRDGSFTRDDICLCERIRMLLDPLTADEKRKFINRVEPTLPMNHEAFSGNELEDLRGRAKRTPLHCAAAFGFASCAELLLDFGADTSSRDGGGMTPLDIVKQKLGTPGQGHRGFLDPAIPGNVASELAMEELTKKQVEVYDHRLPGWEKILNLIQPHDEAAY